MVRQVFVFIHRWAGLAMTVFLVIVGLTGSVVAFREELDVWLNPELLTVAKRDAPLLDPITLREKAAALYPNEQFDAMIPLHIAPDRAVGFIHAKDMSAEDHIGANFNELYLDPYTGEKTGERPLSSGPSLERKNFISFIYNLHYSLAAPSSWTIGGDNIGGYVLGVTALVWTIDCFIAFYLTFPLRWRATGEASRPAKSWWSRWKPAWLIKTSSGFYRLNFDIHRAFGLWTWAMLFVFAWSSVGFNLSAVYRPTMNLLFGSQGRATSANAPARAKRGETPALGWREALAQGALLLRSEAGRRGLQVEAERYLSLSRDAGVYSLVASLSGDVNRRGANVISFDADTGALTEVDFESDLRPGDSITNWLAQLHMAGVFRLPMQIFVCAMGFVITALSVTGVYIWWKKRKARRRRPLAMPQEASAPLHE